MADEHALLARLNLAPSDCLVVDLYWEHRGDVRFVQIETLRYAANAAPGHFARRNPHGALNLVARLPVPAIDSAIVLRVLAHFAARSFDLTSLGLALIPVD
jgi:hypothetical protein